MQREFRKSEKKVREILSFAAVDEKSALIR